MKKTSCYLRFDPSTGEIELEGSEEFIKTYFDKLQKITPRESCDAGRKPEEVPAHTEKEKTSLATGVPIQARVVKDAGKKATPKASSKVSLIDKVVGLVQKSGTGITTADLQNKTGMAKKQVWSVTNRAVGLGRIKTTKRGVFVPG